MAFIPNRTAEIGDTMKNDEELKNLISSLGLKRAGQTNKKTYISIVVEGDCNDADYETEETSFDLDDDEDVELLKDSIKFIKNNKKRLCKKYAISENDALREEIINNEYFELPRAYDDVCHTITSIGFKYTDRNGSSYDLELI